MIDVAEAHRDPRAVAGLAVGLSAGLLGGLLGIGGGLIVVPLLAAWLRMPIKRAVGTSLAAGVATSSIGVLTEAIVAPANLRWSAAGVLAIGGVLGAAVGAALVARIDARRLARLMALAFTLAALHMSGLLHLRDASSHPALADWAAALAHGLTGVVAGVVGALFGIGGGIVAVPALTGLHPDWPFQACRATSLVMILPTALAAALLHRRLANVDGRLAAWLVPGAAAGAACGVLLANRIDGRPLRVAFAAMLIVSAVRLVQSAARTSSEAGPEGGNRPDRPEALRDHGAET